MSAENPRAEYLPFFSKHNFDQCLKSHGEEKREFLNDALKLAINMMDDHGVTDILRYCRDNQVIVSISNDELI